MCGSPCSIGAAISNRSNAPQQAALKASDAAGALEIARRKPAPNAPPAAAKSPELRTRALLPIELAALGELGRPQEAQKRLDEQRKAPG